MDVERAKKRWYASERYDLDSLFRHMIDDAIDDSSRVLDVGAGAGEKFPYTFKDRVKEMVGVDLDPRVKDNTLLHRGLCCGITEIPVEDNYFDVVFCRYVLEHITEPKAFLDEMGRVIKPGGLFIFLTPNKWHYVSVAARMTPHWFHRWFNQRLRHRDEEDTFPTVYLLNSPGSLRKLFTASGFQQEQLIMREVCPNYLCWSLPSFYLGLIYERLVNSTRLLARLRVNFLGVYKKRL